MKTGELSPKALSCWIAVAMLGPVALTAASSAWPGVLVAGILCGTLCLTAGRFSAKKVLDNKLICFAISLWCVYAAAEVAYQAALCFPGKAAGLAVPLVLLVLAAFGSSKGINSACAVGATLLPLCGLIFALVLASGVGNLTPGRLQLAAVPPGGELIFVFLLPMAVLWLPRNPAEPIKWPIISAPIFGVAISIIVMGTLSLPVALTRRDAFYEFSKSLSLFSAVQRFEAVVSAAAVMSAYAMLSLLFSAVGQLGGRIFPGKGNVAIIIATLAGIAVVCLGLWLPNEGIGIYTVGVWAPVAILLAIFKEKDLKKEEIDT